MQLYMAGAFHHVKIRKDLEDKTINTFLLAYENGVVVGYVKLRRDRTYPELEGKPPLEIERIYVLKSHQDMKIGKALMDEAIRIGLEEKMSFLWLGVNKENLKAIRFYKNYDFTIFGEKNFQLGKAVNADYLMLKAL